MTLITALGDPYGSSPEATQHWFPELLRQERARASCIKRSWQVIAVTAARTSIKSVVPDIRSR